MMGHQQGGPFVFAGEIANQRTGRGAGLVVEGREGLIEQEHRPIAQQCAR